MDPVEPSQLPSYHLFSPPAGETDDTARKRAWKGDEFSFRDLLDIINPLQHLPVISTLYRWVTGDTIGNLPRIIGDGLYGGPIGLVAGLFNASVKQESGKDVGEQVIALLGGDDKAAPAVDPMTVAAKDPPAVQETAPSVTAPPIAEVAPIVAPVTAPVATPVAAIAAGPAPAVSGSAAPPPALTSRIGSAPALPAAADATDPRAAFLARTSALHRQLAGDNGQLPGRALSNKVVPLQGVALPAALLRASAPANAPRIASPIAAGDAVPVSSLPSNPPVDISAQMMEALDKYTRLQQRRDSNRDASRGNQVDVTQ